MKLFEQLSALGVRAAEQAGHLATEEATKNALVMPFINALGYNVFNPLEVVPEFTADVGIKKGEKVDYAIVRDGRPVVLVEAKASGTDLDRAVMSQLFRYFTVTDVRIAICTNGTVYRFYSDLERPNRMDEKHFLELDLTDLRAEVVDRLAHITKDAFDQDRLLETATELKYRGQAKRLLEAQLEEPSDEFIRFVAASVVDGRVTRAVREQFGRIARDAFRELVRDRVQSRLRDALERAARDEVAQLAEESLDTATDGAADDIETTADELQGFYIVKGILRRVVDSSRIASRDVQSYFGILLDDNNRKPLARLHFNGRQKYLGLFDNADKSEERLPIQSLDDIYDYADRLTATVGFYEGTDGGE
ncbi:MAG: restriction endonuclease [Acidobacteria bacterium]|nr:MAG: restriction endonuclease [Acidobacteriota bacterium]REK08521.1 MAG: restriction endonuclease [Acidobacteriota bacterium]